MIESLYSEVQRIIKKYGTRDPFKLCTAMHIKVIFSDEYARDGLKGYCTIMNKTKYIVINNKLPHAEKVVVCGHEVGHIVYHGENLRVRAFQDSDIYNATGRLEREANFFDADFLVSDEDVIEEIKTYGADFFSCAKALRIPAPFFAFKLYSMVERGYNVRVPVDLDSRFLAK